MIYYIINSICSIQTIIHLIEPISFRSLTLIVLLYKRVRIRIDLANRNRPVDVDLLRERKQFESCFHSQFGRQCIIYTHSTINLLLDISDRFMISAKVNTTRNVAIQLATLDNFDNSNNSNLNKY